MWNTPRTQYIIIYLHLCQAHVSAKARRTRADKVPFCAIAILLLLAPHFSIKEHRVRERAYSRLCSTAIFLARGTACPHVASSHPPSAALTYYSSAYDRSFIKPESIYPQLGIDRSVRVIYNRHEVRRSRACREPWCRGGGYFTSQAGHVYTDRGSAISPRTVIAGAFERERHARKYILVHTYL
jgi:hypothetical protein